MKRFLVLLWFVIFSFVPGTAFSQRAIPSKVAYFSLDSILADLPEMQSANNKIDAFKKKLDNELQAMKDELSDKKAAIANASDLKPEAKTLKEKEIQDMEEKIHVFEQKSKTDIDTYREEQIEPVMEMVYQAAKEVALSKGYDIVLDSSIATGVVISTNGRDNISFYIRARLGIPEQKK